MTLTAARAWALGLNEGVGRAQPTQPSAAQPRPSCHSWGRRTAGEVGKTWKPHAVAPKETARSVGFAGVGGGGGGAARPPSTATQNFEVLRMPPPSPPICSVWVRVSGTLVSPHPMASTEACAHWQASHVPGPMKRVVYTVPPPPHPPHPRGLSFATEERNKQWTDSGALGRRRRTGWSASAVAVVYGQRWWTTQRRSCRPRSDLPVASAKSATTKQVWALLSHAPDAAGSY